MDQHEEVEMADDDDPDGIGELASASVAPIDEELRHRLTVELAGEDALAIETALLKAFINGMRARSAESAERVLDESIPPPQLGGSPFGLNGAEAPTAGQPEPRLPWLDPWADKYGER